MRHKSPLRRPAILHAKAQMSDKLQEKNSTPVPLQGRYVVGVLNDHLYSLMEDNPHPTPTHKARGGH